MDLNLQQIIKIWTTEGIYIFDENNRYMHTFQGSQSQYTITIEYLDMDNSMDNNEICYAAQHNDNELLLIAKGGSSLLYWYFNQIKDIFYKNLELKKLELETLKLEKLKLEKLELEKLKLKISESIDLYMRKNKNFDSREPLNYSCSINSLINGLTYKIDIPFIDFIKSQERFIFHTDTNLVSLRYITPFQENYRIFGHFKCPCDKKWTSATSWANKYQKCKKCESMIYPFKQLQIERQKNKHFHIKSHDSLRCEKCIQLGKICSPVL